MEISGLAAIVSGGASGLGAAVARKLSAGGARVAVVDRDRQAAEGVAGEVGALAIAADVTSATEVAAALQQAAAAHGEARILVNCAGIGSAGRAVNRDGQPLPLDDFRRVIDVNLCGTFNMCSRFAARVMQQDTPEEERGVIINTASVAAFDGQIGQPAYAAAKGGIVALTLPLAREFARARIRVVTVAPGIFDTPLLGELSAEVRQSLAEQVPFPARLGHPQEFAALVLSIINNPMLNGETIRLDGAIRMAPR